MHIQTPGAAFLDLGQASHCSSAQGVTVRHVLYFEGWRWRTRTLLPGNHQLGWGGGQTGPHDHRSVVSMETPMGVEQQRNREQEGQLEWLSREDKRLE